MNKLSSVRPETCINNGRQLSQSAISYLMQSFHLLTPQMAKVGVRDQKSTCSRMPIRYLSLDCSLIKRRSSAAGFSWSRFWLSCSNSFSSFLIRASCFLFCFKETPQAEQLAVRETCGLTGDWWDYLLGEGFLQFFHLGESSKDLKKRSGTTRTVRKKWSDSKQFVCKSCQQALWLFT